MSFAVTTSHETSTNLQNKLSPMISKKKTRRAMCDKPCSCPWRVGLSAISLAGRTGWSPEESA